MTLERKFCREDGVARGIVVPPSRVYRLARGSLKMFVDDFYVRRYGQLRKSVQSIYRSVEIVC